MVVIVAVSSVADGQDAHRLSPVVGVVGFNAQGVEIQRGLGLAIAPDKVIVPTLVCYGVSQIEVEHLGKRLHVGRILIRDPGTVARLTLKSGEKLVPLPPVAFTKAEGLIGRKAFWTRPQAEGEPGPSQEVRTLARFLSGAGERLVVWPVKGSIPTGAAILDVDGVVIGLVDAPTDREQFQETEGVVAVPSPFLEKLAHDVNPGRTVDEWAQEVGFNSSFEVARIILASQTSRELAEAIRGKLAARPEWFRDLNDTLTLHLLSSLARANAWVEFDDMLKAARGRAHSTSMKIRFTIVEAISLAKKGGEDTRDLESVINSSKVIADDNRELIAYASQILGNILSVTGREGAGQRWVQSMDLCDSNPAVVRQLMLYAVKQNKQPEYEQLAALLQRLDWRTSACTVPTRQLIVWNRWDAARRALDVGRPRWPGSPDILLLELQVLGHEGKIPDAVRVAADLFKTSAAEEAGRTGWGVVSRGEDKALVMTFAEKWQESVGSEESFVQPVAWLSMRELFAEALGLMSAGKAKFAKAEKFAIAYGVLLAQQKKDDDALEVFSTALAANPKSLELARGVCGLSHAKHLWKECAQAARLAIDLGDRDAAVIGRGADACHQLGDTQTEAEMMRILEDVNPTRAAELRESWKSAK